jgi:hypothetical protein
MIQRELNLFAQIGDVVKRMSWLTIQGLPAAIIPAYGNLDHIMY